LSEKVEVRAYEKGDETRIVALLEQVFQGWPHIDLKCSPLDHWKWKYYGPHINKQYITVALSDDNIIGCHHSVAVNVRINDQTRLCTSSFDFAVHPDFRGMGISRMMGDNVSYPWRRRDGVFLDYHITGNPMLIKRALKRIESTSEMKPKFPYSVVNMVWIDDIQRQLEAYPMDKSWLIQLGYPTLKSINILKTRLSLSEYDLSKIKVEDVTKFDGRIESFSGQIDDSHDFIVSRSMRFLNGRYCDPRGGNYVVKQAVENDRVLGFLVLKINRYQDYPVGFIVDLLAIPERFDVVEALIVSAMSYFEANDVNIVNVQLVKGHPNTGILEKMGFLDSRINIRLFYIPFTDEQAITEMNRVKQSRVHVSWGDHDVLPVKIPKYS